MLARVWNRLESTVTASSSRLICTRLIHRSVANSGAFRRSRPRSFEGEELKLRSGFHNIKSLEDALSLFDQMVASRPLPSVFDIYKLMAVIVRMKEHDVVISLHKKMETLWIPCNSIYTMNNLIYCFCRCRQFPYALSTLAKIIKLGFQPDIVTFNTLLRGSSFENYISRVKLNKEIMMFQAALEDLSQPKAEASVPDGVLTVPLMRHQRIALSWMAEKETSGFPCSGGFLADDQGLGKTVSTIALILKERFTPAKACEESEIGECARSEQFGHTQLLFNENKVDGDSIVGKVMERPVAGTLIVCPISVMRQWYDELQKKVASEANLKVLVYYGAGRTKDPHELAKYDVVVTTYSIVSMEVPKEEEEKRRRAKKDDEDEEKADAADSQKRGSKKKKHVEPGPLAKVSWFRVVLDEAHIIKNHKTQVARACWDLHAKRRWCLSGTPIQNKINDLYSYFRFLKYVPYNSYRTFRAIKKNGYEKLQAILKDVMLRRTKGSLLDGKPIISLPPKSIELRKLDFTEEERDFYSKLEAGSRIEFRGYAEAGTVKQNYVNILVMLLRLRQACDHPLLVIGEHSFNWESSVELAKMQNFPEASLGVCGICNDSPEDAVVSVCGHVFCKQCFHESLTGDNDRCPFENCNVRLAAMPSMHDSATSVHVETVDPCSDGLTYESTKIKAALEILQSLARPQESTDMNQLSQKGENPDGPTKLVGEKAIVFSQWTKMMDLLEASLRSSRIQYRRLDGTMSVSARDKAVQDFNTLPEVSVMIMSLKAASLGLNMVAACHVLLLDLWWNPTTEDQAIDRAHCIGQTRPVTVVRFTVKDTVEDRILALQQKKRMMVASVFGEGAKGSRQSHLTVEDMSYLFMEKVQRETDSLSIGCPFDLVQLLE